MISKWNLLLVLAALSIVVSCSDNATVVEDAGVDRSAADQGQTSQDGLTADHSTADLPLVDAGADGAGTNDSGALSCNPAPVTCKSLPGACNIGEIRVVEGSCWGDCVPIEQCGDVPAQPSCDQTQIFCEMVAPECPVGYIPTADGKGCYGPCVPITTCACTSTGPATQCPADLVCHNYAQRCGPLI